MICKPKPHGPNILGGYLLNDELYSEDLLIEKKAYGLKSELSANNNIYDFVNNISITPFKINRELLNYIIREGARHNLLLDPHSKHKYSELTKRIKYQQKVFASHNSKVVLQETILGIAEFYSRFNEIYFPVKLDQRGRLYSCPDYLNYQSNELSKALLLFAKPGIINKNDTSSIAYLKAYGANSFGGKTSKASFSYKSEWVDKNLDNIINYDNGILLNKANDKLLFLAFCIEYKRFYEFYVNENAMEFHSHLPIQLDATCNGFQHMALLSNEDTLFKELNLVSGTKNKSSDVVPSDFYSFLLHKVIDYISNKVEKGEEVDNEGKGGSYKRLYNFIWDRSHIKKPIMTIPYNVSSHSMKKYLAESLVRMDYYEGNCYWYSTSEKNTKSMINTMDLALLVSTLKYIIGNDFEKIKKLTKYLKNIATLLNYLGLPITWTLPTGLTINQSYLLTKSTSITPFIYSKIKLKLKVAVKGEYDQNKQIRALMPNLIHSLDATSLCLLYEQFRKSYLNGQNHVVQFFSVHDCFGTTCDKVPTLKTILASVYTDLYSREPYLYQFDKSILDSIAVNTDAKWKFDRANRTIQLNEGEYTIHDVDWVLNKKHLSSLAIKKIDSSNIII